MNSCRSIRIDNYRELYLHKKSDYILAEMFMQKSYSSTQQYHFFVIAQTKHTLYVSCLQASENKLDRGLAWASSCIFVIMFLSLRYTRQVPLFEKMCEPVYYVIWVTKRQFAYLEVQMWKWGWGRAYVPWHPLVIYGFPSKPDIHLQR